MKLRVKRGETNTHHYPEIDSEQACINTKNTDYPVLKDCIEINTNSES